MPILPREPDIHPSQLLDEAIIASAPQQPWWVMYTLPRREKELMRRLRALDIAYYSPLVHKRARSPSGRMRESYVPLFPSYVFVCGSEPARQQSLTTQCVSRT
ncbi:MAG: UpxY family transcription antiterminator, partial [Pirellulales bacterium]